MKNPQSQPKTRRLRGVPKFAQILAQSQRIPHDPESRSCQCEACVKFRAKPADGEAEQLVRLDEMDEIHSTGQGQPHSPLPFSEDPEGEKVVGIEDAQGRVIAYASIQDAPFIVRACNSYAGLTESDAALADLLSQLEAIGIYIPGEDTGQWADASGLSFRRAEQARSALKAATEGQA